MARTDHPGEHDISRARPDPDGGGFRRLGQTLAGRVTLRSAVAAAPFWVLAGGFLLVCGFGVSVWGLEEDYFKQVLIFQLLAMHAGVFLGAAAAARPKTLPGHGMRLVAFGVLCALYSNAGHQRSFHSPARSRISYLGIMESTTQSRPC